MFDPAGPGGFRQLFFYKHLTPWSYYVLLIEFEINFNSIADI